MRVFFRGWRRKIDCVTVVLSCVLTAEWVCTLQDIRDIAVFVNGKHTTEGFVSGENSISWIRVYNEDVAPTSELKRIDFSDDPSCHNGAFLDPRIDWDLLWCGFGSGRIGGPQDRNWLKVCWVVPYWSIVLPLTAITFWLLLPKPRPSTSKSIASIASTAIAEGA